MRHPYRHTITTYDGQTIEVTSTHHQMQNPFNLDPKSFKILGHSDHYSSILQNGKDENVRSTVPVDVEIALYNEQTLAVQGHPEFEDAKIEFKNFVAKELQKLIENKIKFLKKLDNKEL